MSPCTARTPLPGHGRCLAQPTGDRDSPASCRRATVRPRHVWEEASRAKLRGPGRQQGRHGREAATGSACVRDGTQGTPNSRRACARIPRPSARSRRPGRGRRPDLVEAEANDVETCSEMFPQPGEILGSPIVGATNLQVRLILPRTKSVSTTRRTRTGPEDVICLHFCELRTKRLNLRDRHVAGREAQRKRMLTRDDTLPRMLPAWNEHHGAGFRKVVINRHGSPNRTKTGYESPRVVHGEMEAGLQRLRVQTRLLERRTKRRRRRRIEPQEGEDCRVRTHPARRTT